MDDFEREIKESFLEELGGWLDEVELCLIDLEKGVPQNGEENRDAAAGAQGTLESLLRVVHNIKGTAKSVGFDGVSEISNRVESIIQSTFATNGTQSNPQIKIPSSTLELLLRWVDHLRSIMKTLKSDLNSKLDSSGILLELNTHLVGKVLSDKLPILAASPEKSEAVPPENEGPGLWEDIPSADLFDGDPAKPEAAPTSIEPSTVEPVTVIPEKASRPPEVHQKTESKENDANQNLDQTVRVHVKKLEQLLNCVGELVILQEILDQQGREIQNPEFRRSSIQLSKITQEIRDLSMGLRLTPLNPLFQKMQRMVRDVAKALGKEVVLEIQGENTEIDKVILDLLTNPLMHLIRNALDHGFELPSEREKSGKSRKGKLSLRASHEGSSIVIEVADDGRGLSKEKIRNKAIERELLNPFDEISAEEIYQFIFVPGFTTKEAATEFSGRGIGMDVVKANLESLQGEIEILTEEGKGTCFRITLPLTLSIIEGIVIQSRGERYVIPLAHVRETIQPEKTAVVEVSGLGEIFRLRGENLPLYRLGKILNRELGRRDPWESIAIVLGSGRKRFSVLVDDIVGKQQVVIKPVGAELRDVRGISGSTILGDGRAALILDFPELVETYVA